MEGINNGIESKSDSDVNIDNKKKVYHFLDRFYDKLFAFLRCNLVVTNNRQLQ